MITERDKNIVRGLRVLCCGLDWSSELFACCVYVIERSG